MSKIKIVFIFWMALLFLSSCGVRQHKESFLRSNVDPSYINKVAILKFSNNSKNPYAAERMRNIVATVLLSKGLFDVIDTGIVDSLLAEEGQGERVYKKAFIRRFSKKLGVQAVILGSVDEYNIQRHGTYSYPVVALTLTLMDASTGEIIWQASGMRSAYSFWGRIFGCKPKDFTQLSFDLVEDLLDSLPKRE